MKRTVCLFFALILFAGSAACGAEDQPPQGTKDSPSQSVTDPPAQTASDQPAQNADPLASLRAGPQTADEKAALAFVGTLGEERAMRSPLELRVLKSPPLRAFMPQYGLTATGAAEKTAMAKAVADFLPLWNLSVSRAYLTRFSVAELQSIEKERAASPYYDRYLRAQPAIAFAAAQANEAVLDAAYDQVVADVSRALTGK